MSQIAIELFGAPTVYLDGRPVYIRRRKALALLVYLAASQRPHGRDELAGLFWPEQPQQAARGNLRRAIFSLHRRLGSDAPHIAGDRVSLPVGPDLTVDVADFHRRINGCKRAAYNGRAPQEQAADLEQAVALYQDDFARSLSLADCPEFEEWLRVQTESLRADLTWTLTVLVDGYVQAGMFDQALGHARRLQALDPYADDAVQQIMRIHALTGQTAAALRVYEHHADLLSRELDLPPGEVLQQTYDLLRANMLPLHADPTGGADATPAVQAASPPASAHGLPGTAPIDDSPPFVAREFALAALGRAFAAAHSGQGQILFVAGEAGSGKTTLIQEFARRLRSQHPDLIVAAGACTSFGFVAEPLQPFVEIMRRLTGVSTLNDSGLVGSGMVGSGSESGAERKRQAQATAIARQAVRDFGPNLVGRVIPPALLAAPGSTAEPDVNPAAPGRPVQALDATAPQRPETPIHEELSAVFQRIAEQRPLLLVLDDLQWSDPSTAALLYHLARRSDGLRILTIGAYRPEEVAQHSGQPHPLGDVLDELQQRYGPIRLSLDLQAEAEARHFVDALLDSEPNRLDEAFRRDLFLHSRGHALFTVELVRQMKETGQLRRGEDGYWTQGDTVDWSVLPSKVEASIARRFHRLSPALHRLLAIASVEGEQFTAEVLAMVLDREVSAVITQLSLLAQAEHGLVNGVGIERTGALRLARYRFRHNLFQQYAYHALDPTERQHLHLQVGRAIESLYQVDGDALASVAALLANHFDQAAAVEAASRYHLLAGRRAIRLSAFAEAREHLSRGLNQVRSLPAGQRSAERELELVLELSAPVGVLRGYSHPDMNTLQADALQLATQIKDQQKVFRTIHGIWRYWGLRSEMKQTRRLAGELLAIAEEQQDEQMLVQARRAKGVTAFHFGELSEAGAWLAQCLALYDPERHAAYTHQYGHDPGVSAAGYLAHVRWLEGDANAAVALATQAVRLAEELDHPFSLAHALGFGYADICKFQHRPDQVLDAIERLTVLATRHSYPMWKAVSAILGGWAKAALGKHGEGIDQLQSGLDAWRSMGNRALLPYYVGLLVEAYAMAGNRTQALETVNLALDLVEQTAERWWEPELRRLRKQLQ